jgi:hypothetical protein
MWGIDYAHSRNLKMLPSPGTREIYGEIPFKRLKTSFLKFLAISLVHGEGSIFKFRMRAIDPRIKLPL